MNKILCGLLIGLSFSVTARKKVDREQQAKLNRTFKACVKNNNLEKAQMLLEQSVHVNWYLSLLFTAMYGHTDMARMLIRWHLDKNVDEQNLLIMSVGLGRLWLVKLMLNEGVDIEQQDDHGFSPLREAVVQGKTDFIKLFLARGASVNAIDFSGATPLINAVLCSYKDIVALLLVCGADCTVTDDDGKTAYMYAVDNEYDEIVHMLENHDIGELEEGESYE